MNNTENGKAKQNGNLARSCPVCGMNGCEDLLRAPDRYHGRSELYQLIRCPSCTVVWLENAPQPSEMGLHYGRDYDRSVAAAGADPNRWLEHRNDLLKYKSGGAVLDLGCSSGGFLTSIKGSSWKLFGIEMSEEVAQMARDRCGAEIFVGDVLDAPFPPASFDAITCFHVFEHLYHPQRLLAKVAEWLKPGGVFFTFMPNIDSAGARIFGSYWYALELPRHLYHFSPTSLRNVAHSVGLQEVSVTTHREVFIESSVRYLLDAGCQKMGISRVPLAQSTGPSLGFRIVRKAFRLSILPVLNGLAGLAGDGESIHAVFKRDASKSEERTV